jgi:hypothetical protein
MNKWLRVVAIVVILALLFIPTIIAMRFVAIAQIYGHFVESASNLTGLNKYLIKAGVALMLVPFFIGLRFFLSINRTRRMIGTSILVSCLILYNLGLYQSTKGSYFSFSEGKVLKWYALTPEGVKFFDREGVDPVYGIPLKPVTPDVVRNLRLLEKGDFKTVDPSSSTWFNPITGEPQLWYYRYPDGRFEFYDKPGYHPVTGDQLVPVSKEVFFEWREKAGKRKVVGVLDRKSERGATGNERTAYGAPSDTSAPSVPVDERERRLSRLRALINKGIAHQSGKPNVAMVIESKRSEGGASPEQALYDLLKVENVNIITNLFREPFKAKGYFRDIYDGNTGLLREAGAFQSVDYIVLGRLDYSFRKGAAVESDLVSCNLSLSYRIINKDGEVVKSDSIRAVGPGLSEDAALERGLEILSDQYSIRISKSVL